MTLVLSAYYLCVLNLSACQKVGSIQEVVCSIHCTQRTQPLIQCFQQTPAGRGAFDIHSPAFASSPGMTEMVLSARSTLNVLKADTLPRSTNSVTYLQQAGRQKHKNRHTQKGMTTLSNNEPTQRDRSMEREIQ